MERVSLGSNRVATGETRLLSLIFRSKWIWTGWFFFFFFFFTGPFPVCYDLVMGRQVGSYRTNTKGRRSEVKGGPYGSRVGRRQQKNIKKKTDKEHSRFVSTSTWNSSVMKRQKSKYGEQKQKEISLAPPIPQKRRGRRRP